MLRLKVDRFLEALMQNLINLIPNSAKIMSTSGIGKKKIAHKGPIIYTSLKADLP